VKGGSTVPRPPKPYLERDHYISRAGGERIKLCHRSHGMAKAREILREHLKKRRQDLEQHDGRVLPSLTVKELFVLFLQSMEAEKSDATFRDYQWWCVEFARLHGNRLAILTAGSTREGVLATSSTFGDLRQSALRLIPSSPLFGNGRTLPAPVKAAALSPGGGRRGVIPGATLERKGR
jgi:hypothetical protein